MKKMFLLATSCLFFVACNNPYANVSKELSETIEKRMDSLEISRSEEIKKSIIEAPEEQQEGLAYLYAYMPQADFDTLSVSLIKENVAYAYKAREVFPWAKDVPEDIFLNDVLPYASMDETRENWRPEFFEMLSPVLKNTTDVYAAVDTINKVLKDLVKVEYNTKRNKPNQSPKESMSINMASCSGLSILLTDALRAVGIPSRIAGTPMWITNEGNHNWNEVWINGEWLLIEYYPAPLNDAWFLPRCAAFEGQDNPDHQVYATTFKPVSEQHFPMVWDEEDHSIPGVKVTDRYVKLYKQNQLAKSEGTQGEVSVVVRGFCKGGNPEVSADRRSIDVIILDENNDQVAKGQTRNSNADMNDYLVFNLADNKKYTILFGNQKLEIKTDSQKENEYNLYF